MDEEPLDASADVADGHRIFRPANEFEPPLDAAVGAAGLKGSGYSYNSLLPPLSLTTGTRVGPYRVFGPLGAGGMGEVYRARDTKLNRDCSNQDPRRPFAGDTDRLRDSSVKRRSSRRSTIRTSGHIYGVRTVRRTRTRSSWSWSKARDAGGAHCKRVRCRSSEALLNRASDCARTRGRTRAGNRPPQSETGQHQDHTGRCLVKVLDFGLAKR